MRSPLLQRLPNHLAAGYGRVRKGAGWRKVSSPSPRPSPPGRGRKLAQSFDRPKRLDLSPRGMRSPVFGGSNAAAASSSAARKQIAGTTEGTSEFHRGVRPRFPLPGGEGQGEGEET